MPDNTHRPSWKRLLPYLTSHAKDFSVAAVSMCFVAALSSGSVGLVKPVIDQIFIEKDIEMLKTLSLIIPIIFFAKSLFSYLLNYHMAKIGHAAAKTIRAQILEKLLSLDHSYHTRAKSSEALSRSTNDVMAISNMVANAPLYIIRDGLTVTFLMMLIFYLNWRFATAIIITMPVFAGLFILFTMMLRKITRRIQELVAVLYSIISEGLNGLTMLKVFLYEKKWLKHFDEQNTAHYKALLKFQKITALAPSLNEFLSSLIITLILFAGGLQVINDAWSPGSFMAFLSASFAAYMPMKHLAQVNPIIQMGLTSWKRVLEILDLKPSIINAALPKTIATIEKQIAFEQVSFSYEPGHAILKSMDLKIPKGEILGLAGPSGSGKTTMAMMLGRFYDPAQGRITIDNTDIKDLSIPSLRTLLGAVSQDAFLFDSSIEENIMMGKPGSTFEEIKSAASQAYALEFIEYLPDGFKTLVGERGARLSAGQKQRIAIARAILKNPKILILDEATSNLDPESEEFVLAAIKELLQNRTALVISHRLKTLSFCNRIIVMEKGEIVEETACAQTTDLGSRLTRLMKND
ncbi:ABC transporter ATP-binding protein [Elusimicrobiota bacterium]